MELYRLTRKKYGTELSGKGAAIKGARWNSPGVEVIYTAMNRSLAMAEVAVHLSLGTLPDDYQMLTIYVPDSVSMAIVNSDDLPNRWQWHPALGSTQKIGDNFIQTRSHCLLKTPSAVTQGDYNVLINPFHKEFNEIKVVSSFPFQFDRRLF